MSIKPKYTSFKDGKLFEEAIALTMAMNSSYHQPHELRDLMSQLTGETVPDSLRIFPPFYTDLAKISFLMKMFLLILVVTFRTKAVSLSAVEL